MHSARGKGDGYNNRIAETCQWSPAGGPQTTASEALANARLIAAAPDLLEPAPRAADFLEQYAEYIRTVKADELERHPYLPEIEQVAADLRGAIAKALARPSSSPVEDRTV